ncbi:VOC family protein [Novosphingobium sp.]|uniref:VOC family protein n=1 Tax=Novosphingobium sp. TaxID=1874826 RepID=UPI002FE3B87F
MTDNSSLLAQSEKLKTLKLGTAALPNPWVSEIVLQTNQYDWMKLWYEAVLGSDWFLENKPDTSVTVANHHGDGGKQVHAKDVRSCFMRLVTTYPYSVVFALFEITTLRTAPTDDPGLNHMQLKHPDLETLIRRIELLRDADIHPHRSANHGPMTSFYFRDPDENIIELCIDNFESPADMAAFIQSDAFKANPSGIDIERDEFIARFRAGVAREELLAI